ncbi:hypothetical protein J4T77_03160 [Wolbachia endosymbiont of Drosophila innubila]|uniref:hypothetical protein n=1 Tax=Wolbachia TaxID=953 RepID=UPI001680AFFD|nr:MULTISPECIES: hypothetical protein [Wolbachia]MBA8752986.1 hypothetical protein [Wolbachia pipientis]UID81778.1 hypothetical protein J4T77_03160 [Wolbachia endosymbiont of Drosophila innubila]
MPKTQSSGSCSEEVRISSEVTKQELSTPFMKGCVITLMDWLIVKINKQGLSVKLLEELKEEVKSLEESRIEFIYKKIMKDISDSIKPEPSSPMKTDEQGVEPSKVKPEPSSPMKTDEQGVEPSKVKPEPSSPMKTDEQGVEPSKVKPEPSNPMKIKEKAVQVTQGLPSAVKQEQDPSGSTKLMELIRPSYLQVLEWFEQHIYFFDVSNLGSVLSGKDFLRWTEDVMVDKKETAKSLIDGDFLGAKQMYELACLYCLKDCVEKSWGSLGEKEKGEYGEKRDVPHLAKFWASTIGSVMGVVDYISGLELAVEYGTESAIKYFLDNLPTCGLTEEQTENLGGVLVNLAVVVAGKNCFNTEPTMNYTNIFDRLLQEVENREFDSSRIKKGFPYYFLSYFLNHKHNCFLEEVPDDLLQRDYQRLLLDIAAKEDEQLFIGFLDLKEDKGLQRINGLEKNVLLFLFQLSEDNIKRLFDSFTLEEKQAIIFYIRNNIYSLVTSWNGKDRLDLKLIIEKCLPDEEKRKRLMEELFSSKGCGICVSLIVQGSEELADEFVNLCFPQNQEKINKSRELMLLDNVEEITDIILNSCAHGELVAKFGDIFEWVSLPDDKKVKFKERIIDRRGCNICARFIREGNSTSADEFLNWCLPDDKDKKGKIDKLKLKLVFGGMWGRNFCVSGMRDGKQEVVESFLEWLNLPEKQRDKFLSQCRNILKKDEEDNVIYNELERALNPVEGENEERQKKRPRVSDGCIEKPEVKLSRSSGNPDGSMQAVRAEDARYDDSKSLSNEESSSMHR